MEINYIRRHNESYMVLEIEDAISNYEKRMIEENDIAALLNFMPMNLNGCMQYHYNISRKENLEDFLDSHDLNLEMFRRIILNLQLAFDELGKYLIDERHIWLDTEAIFLEKSSDNFKISLCYYPKDMGSVQEQFRAVMECVLKKAPNTNKDFARLLYSAYDLCLKDDYTLGEILDLLEPMELEEIEVERINLREDTEVNHTADLMAEEYPIEQEYLADFQQPEKQGFLNRFWPKAKEILTKRIEFKDEFVGESEDFVIDPDYEIEERTVLLTETKPVGRLVYDGQGQENDFLVNKDIFRIGKSKSCDAVLQAPTISQTHAKIVKEGDDYYLSDMNSTNSTFLNNEELPYRKPVKLHICDKIRFANVCYTFM